MIFSNELASILAYSPSSLIKLKSDPNFVLQNLPAGVAMRLAAGEKIAPERHNNVAVIFAGVVGRH
jgi:hypothetical protein